MSNFLGPEFKWKVTLDLTEAGQEFTNVKYFRSLEEASQLTKQLEIVYGIEGVRKIIVEPRDKSKKDDNGERKDLDNQG